MQEPLELQLRCRDLASHHPVAGVATAIPDAGSASIESAEIKALKVDVEVIKQGGREETQVCR